jgi:hypothetical protein
VTEGNGCSRYLFPPATTLRRYRHIRWAGAEADRLSYLRSRFPWEAPNASGDGWGIVLPDFKLDATTADWSKLAKEPGSSAEYIKGLGDRLIIIACAKAGGESVVRGLIGSQMLCSFKDKVREVVRTGRRPDGEECQNVDVLRALPDQWAACPALNGKQ